MEAMHFKPFTLKMGNLDTTVSCTDLGSSQVYK